MLNSSIQQGSHLAKLLPAATMLALFVAVTLSSSWQALNESCEKSGDHSLIAIEVERAKAGEALYGAYSRTGVRHPGPLQFYLYALGEIVLPFPESVAGKHCLTQFLINCFFLLATLYLAHRFVRQPYSLCLLLILVLLLFRREQQGMLFDTWGPATVLAPMLCFLFSVTNALRGSGRSLIFLLLSGGVLAQTHFGTGIIVLPLGVLAVLTLLQSQLKEKPQLTTGAVLGYILCGLWVFILAAPVCLDVFRNGSSSNIVNLLSYILHVRPRIGSYEALNYLSHFFRIGFGGGYRIDGLILIITSVCALIYLVFKSPKTCRVPAAVALLSLVLSFLGALSIDTTRYHFLMWWQHSVVVFVYYTLLSSVWERLSAGRYVSKKALGVLVYLCFVAITVFSAQRWYHKALVGCRIDFIDRLFEIEGDATTVLPIIIHDAKLWKQFSAVALAVRRSGRAFCVEDEWKQLFGSDLLCSRLSVDEMSAKRLHIFPAKRINQISDQITIHRNKRLLVTIESGG